MVNMYSRGIKFLDGNVKIISTLRRIIQITPLRQWWRSQIASSYLKPQRRMARSWIWKRTENDNFYYDLSSSNREDLAHLISLVTGKPLSEIKGYIQELASNDALRDHIASAWKTNPNLKDAFVGFGRREGWYAIIRAIKPKLVVETDTSHGVGACVIASAILQNRSEGHEGSYVGTDWDPDAGFLLSGAYAEAGKIVYGDSIESLTALNSVIDLFINDSDHSPDYEAREYVVVAPKLSLGAFILGDNSHTSPSLRNFAEKSLRPFVFFKEVPKDHWYPGAGIGISPPRQL